MNTKINQPLILIGRDPYCRWGVKPCTNRLLPPVFLAFFNASAFARDPGPDFPRSPPRFIELTLEVSITRTIAVLG